MKIMITLNLCCQIGQEGCLDLPHGEPASVEAEDGDLLVALPDLNRGPPDGCPQPSVSSLQSGALAN